MSAEHAPQAVPKTPLRILAREADIPAGPFFVAVERLAQDREMGEPSDEEVDALAKLIYNAYLEWRSQ